MIQYRNWQITVRKWFHALGSVKRAGFKTLFADGHGPSRKEWSRQLEERRGRFVLVHLGVDSQRDGWTSQIDRAAGNETSFVLATRPHLADRSIWP